MQLLFSPTEKKYPTTLLSFSKAGTRMSIYLFFSFASHPVVISLLLLHVHASALFLTSILGFLEGISQSPKANNQDSWLFGHKKNWNHNKTQNLRRLLLSRHSKMGFVFTQTIEMRVVCFSSPYASIVLSSLTFPLTSISSATLSSYTAVKSNKFKQLPQFFSK